MLENSVLEARDGFFSNPPNKLSLSGSCEQRRYKNKKKKKQHLIQLTFAAASERMDFLALFSLSLFFPLVF